MYLIDLQQNYTGDSVENSIVSENGGGPDGHLYAERKNTILPAPYVKISSGAPQMQGQN